MNYGMSFLESSDTRLFFQSERAISIYNYLLLTTYSDEILQQVTKLKKKRYCKGISDEIICDNFLIDKLFSTHSRYTGSIVSR
jgi:hypothetical protein